MVAATNRDLERAVEEGRFRDDLYHRLAVYPIHVPPLRERREDIPLLAAHFLDHGRRRQGLARVRLAERAREALTAADWPGNVRELQNVVTRGVLRAADGVPAGETVVVDLEHLDLRPADGVPTEPSTAAPDATGTLADRPLAVTRPPPAGRPGRRLQAPGDRRRPGHNDGNWAAAARALGTAPEQPPPPGQAAGAAVKRLGLATSS